MDENLAHCSYEAGILEDPNTTPPADMWKLTVDPKEAPDKEELFTVEFKKGIPTKLQYTEDGKSKTVTDAVDILTAANTIGRRNGVGRIDIVENRFIGIKSRGETFTATCPRIPHPKLLHRPAPLDHDTDQALASKMPTQRIIPKYTSNNNPRCYETPGLTLLHLSHLDLEGLTMDREVRSLRDAHVTLPYGRALYNGHYFSPQREYLHASIVASQKDVNGT
ncbi:MAG: hypothetical protein Q9198_011255, partial [Flavoplaca austrocitrina]